jgi:hypothetical protein
LTLVLTLFVREGIVMASDSRLTLTETKQPQPGQSPVQILAVGQSDSTYKTFCAPNNIGISTFGDADIEGVPLAGYIESFITDILGDGGYQVDEVPALLIDYFKKMPKVPNTGFHIAGYKVEKGKRNQEVWVVQLNPEEVKKYNEPGVPGAIWSGEHDILTRLVTPVYVPDEKGGYIQLPTFLIPWQYFTLQDAIDFAVYAIRSTIDTLRFQPRPKTVGGPIDVLVIKPKEAQFIQRKELHT